MKWLRRPYRLTLLIGHLLVGLILSLLLFSPLLFPRTPDWRLKIVTRWSRVLCQICGLQIQCYGQRAPTPALFVANHISWLDIFALLSTFPVTFVSKQEVRSWPLIGWLAHRVGTLFLRRGQFEASALATHSIVNALFNQMNVLFFPEGTSTEGRSVKRFHARIFQAAIDTGVQVQPVALRYPQGKDINLTVPYIGKDSFLVHLWRILGEPELQVELWFCPPISSDNKKRRELAHYTQVQVSNILERFSCYYKT